MRWAFSVDFIQNLIKPPQLCCHGTCKKLSDTHEWNYFNANFTSILNCDGKGVSGIVGDGSLLGGGRVTRFPFGPLNVFRIHFTLGRPGKLSKQAAFWRRLPELMVNARASWCNSTGSKSKQHDHVLMQNWNVIQLNLISFFTLGRSSRKIFVWLLLGPYARA